MIDEWRRKKCNCNRAMEDLQQADKQRKYARDKFIKAHKAESKAWLRLTPAERKQLQKERDA